MLSDALPGTLRARQWPRRSLNYALGTAPRLAEPGLTWLLFPCLFPVFFWPKRVAGSGTKRPGCTHLLDPALGGLRALLTSCLSLRFVRSLRRRKLSVASVARVSKVGHIRSSVRPETRLVNDRFQGYGYRRPTATRRGSFSKAAAQGLAALVHTRCEPYVLTSISRTGTADPNLSCAPTSCWP